MYGISTIRKILLIKNKEKLSIRKTAKRFALSTRTVHKWDKGIISKGARICQARKLDMEGLKEDVMKHPDLYQYERAEKFKVSQNCIDKALKRLKVTYKKNFQTSRSKRRRAYIV